MTDEDRAREVDARFAMLETLADYDDGLMEQLLEDIQPARENVFKDKRLSAQVPGHLSLFDAYNLATEIRTHTRETEGSSMLALDKMANDFIFNHQDLTQHASRFTRPRDASFGDHETAFFGQLKVVS
jgi:hypothetical protein